MNLRVCLNVATAVTDRRGGDSVSKMDVNFKKLVREHRGTGLALLTADTECRNALIEHCYHTPYIDEGHQI